MTEPEFMRLDYSCIKRTAPRIQGLTDEEIYKYKVLDDISITCQAFGQPVPNVTWYQNDSYVTSGIGKRNHGSNDEYTVYIADMIIRPI